MLMGFHEVATDTERRNVTFNEACSNSLKKTPGFSIHHYDEAISVPVFPLEFKTPQIILW